MKTQRQIESDFIHRIAPNSAEFRKVKDYTNKIQQAQMRSIK